MTSPGFAISMKEERLFGYYISDSESYRRIAIAAIENPKINAINALALFFL